MSRIAVPGRAVDTTVNRAYPVARPFSAPTVTTFVPNPSATSTAKRPAASAVADPVVVGEPTSVGAVETPSLAPGAVVPVTWAVLPGVTVPSAGVVTVNGS